MVLLTAYRISEITLLTAHMIVFMI